MSTQSSWPYCKPPSNLIQPLLLVLLFLFHASPWPRPDQGRIGPKDPTILVLGSQRKRQASSSSARQNRPNPSSEITSSPPESPAKIYNTRMITWEGPPFQAVPNACPLSRVLEASIQKYCLQFGLQVYLFKHSEDQRAHRPNKAYSAWSRHHM